MRNLKQAQASFFLVFVLIVILVFFLVQNYQSQAIQSSLATETQQTALAPYEKLPLERSAKFCLEATAKEGVKKLGQQGGFFHVPQSRKVVWYGVDVPLYLNKEILHTPPIELLEQELGAYVNRFLRDCIKKQNPFLNIALRGKTTTQIDLDQVAVVFDGTIAVSPNQQSPQQEKTQELRISSLSVRFSSPYGKLFQFAERTVLEHYALQKQPMDIPLSKITDLAILEGIYVTFIQRENDANNTFVIILKMNEPERDDGRDERFQFGVAYDW